LSLKNHRNHKANLVCHLFGSLEPAKAANFSGWRENFTHGIRSMPFSHAVLSLIPPVGRWHGGC
jgi:hypothetical protein